MHMDTHTYTYTHIYTHTYTHTHTTYTHTHTNTQDHMNLQVRKGQIIQPMHTLLTDNGYGTAAWKPEDPLHLQQQHKTMCDLRCGQ